MGKAMLPMLGMAGLAAATGGLGGLGMGLGGAASAGAGAGALGGASMGAVGAGAPGILSAMGPGVLGSSTVAGMGAGIPAGFGAAAAPGFFGAGGSLSNSLSTAGKIQSMMGGMGQEQPQQSASPMGGGSMSRGGVGPADFARAANLTQPQQGISALQSFLNGGMQA
jgi:hypothetical protein